MSVLTSQARRGQAYAWATIWFSPSGILASPLIGRAGGRASVPFKK